MLASYSIEWKNVHEKIPKIDIFNFYRLSYTEHCPQIIFFGVTCTTTLRKTNKKFG